MTRQMADDEVIGATNFDVLDEVAHDLESWCNAYPPQRFPEPEEADLKWLHATKPGLCDRISASMGRHMVKHMRRMAASVRSIEAKQMAAVAALQAERDRERKYATTLAQAMLRKHYAEDAPQWEPCPDVLGVLTQIDNMTTGLTRTERAERAESALEALRGQVAELVAAANAVTFDTYALTAPETRAAFDGRESVAVVRIDTLDAFRTALLAIKERMG